MSESYRETGSKQLRVLFCMGVMPAFFEGEPARIGPIAAAITAALDDLGGRFGLTVLGTMDDDELMVGSSPTWPWTCYILADVPDLGTATQVCNVVRESEVAGARLWKYLKVEARVGRRLFFGNA